MLEAETAVTCEKVFGRNSRPEVFTIGAPDCLWAGWVPYLPWNLHAPLVRSQSMCGAVVCAYDVSPVAWLDVSVGKLQLPPSPFCFLLRPPSLPLDLFPQATHLTFTLPTFLKSLSSVQFIRFLSIFHE
jgi:hypothetical protein